MNNIKMYVSFIKNKYGVCFKKAAVIVFVAMLAPLAFANKAEIEDNGAEPEYSAEACPLEQADVCKDVHEYVNAVINGADDKVLSTLAAIDDEKVLKFYLSRRISWNSYSELDTELSRLYKRLD